MRLPPGDLIRASRLQSGLSIDELATRVELPAELISRLERGERRISPAIEERLARELKMPSIYHDRSALSDTGGFAATDIQPFKGLYQYTLQDSAIFFGRTDVSTNILTALSYSSICLVSGPSGVGKSSVLSAGVLADLAQDSSNAICTMRPGTDPIDSLSIAVWRMITERGVPASSQLESHQELRETLGRPGFILDLKRILGCRSVVFFVDQLEELFRLTAPRERDEFLRFLSDVMTRHASYGDVKLLSAVRSDFLDSVAKTGELSRLFSAHVYLIPPLGREDIAEIIRAPLELAGCTIDRRVSEQLCDQIEGRTTALPLLSLTMETLWRNRAGQEISLADWESSGGVEGIIARIGEGTVSALSKSDLAEARSLLVSLVAFAPVGALEPNTKKKLVVENLTQHQIRLVDKFVSSRLLATDRDLSGKDTVEFAHEAIMTAWPRLVSWIQQDEEIVRFLDTLGAAADEWKHSGKSPLYLWQGERLRDCLSRFEEIDVSRRGDDEREFVGASQLAQSSSDASTLKALSDILETLPNGAWGSFATQFSALDNERLRAAYAAAKRKSSFREAAVLASRGLDTLQNILEGWENQPDGERLVAAYLVKMRGDDDDPLLSYLRTKADLSIADFLAVTFALGTEIPDAENDDFPNIPQAPSSIVGPLSLIEPHIASEIFQQAITRYPQLLHQIIALLYNPEDVAAFSCSYFLIRDVAAKNVDWAAICLCESPPNMFDDMFRRAPGRADGQLAVALSGLSRSGNCEQEAQRISALVQVGESTAMHQLLSSSQGVGTSAWAVCKSRELLLGDPANRIVDELVEKFSRDDRENSIALGHAIQISATFDGEGSESDLVQRVLAVADTCRDSFVVASAEWALRQRVPALELPNALNELPASGENFISPKGLQLGRPFRFVECPPQSVRIGKGGSRHDLVYLDSPVTFEAITDRSFWIADRLVWRDLYELGCGEMGRDWFDQIDHVASQSDAPIVAVTWDEATEFCDWLASSFVVPGEKPTVRLPSEIEWELASRAGSTDAFCFGENEQLLPEYAWYAPNSKNLARPAGDKRPNLLGLFDVHGNCWEWCLDWFKQYPLQVADPQIVPMSDAVLSNGTRSLRGGCWNLSTDYARCFTRNAHLPTNRNYYLSFRPALEWG